MSDDGSARHSVRGLGRAAKSLPLHDLVTQSTADLAAIEPYKLAARISRVPKNGANKVLDDLEHNGSLYKQHSRVLAWLDNDRIRDALHVPPSTKRADVIAKIKARGPQTTHGRPPPLEVFLLDNNLEDLLSTLEDHLDPAILAKALRKKLDDRDMLLDDIARNPALRAELRARHAGFDCVSRFVACIATTAPWPPI